eukprot:TRINITY_DN6088_c1_g1_i1.p1 TRINITY_DN6088_c1_g1~~TRINITY_DN6088_c1_g1_i1.p1  ORF type:complete len:135 (-),score=4.98 TRINITY_DN6088_c1_g1_i1:44-400(-)
MSSLMSSLNLVLDEFYANLNCVGVSAVTGKGIDEFFEAIKKAALDYEKGYKAELLAKIAEKRKIEEERQKENLERLKRDLETSKGRETVLDTKKPKKEDSAESEGEEDDAMEDEETIY